MKLIVVDDNDIVIGTKNRDDMKPSDIYRVSRLLMVNSKGQLLLAQRAFTKQKDPGVWGLAVEGTVEENEDYETNIRKEAQEEIGITLGRLQAGPKFSMTGKYKHYSQFFIYHADLDAAKLHLQEDELAAVKWYEPLALRQEVADRPEKFGYNFSSILETAWPYITNYKH